MNLGDGAVLSRQDWKPHSPTKIYSGCVAAIYAIARAMGDHDEVAYAAHELFVRLLGTMGPPLPLLPAYVCATYGLIHKNISFSYGLAETWRAFRKIYPIFVALNANLRCTLGSVVETEKRIFAHLEYSIPFTSKIYNTVESFLGQNPTLDKQALRQAIRNAMEVSNSEAFFRLMPLILVRTYAQMIETPENQSLPEICKLLVS